jgi:hypothetical protein
MKRPTRQEKRDALERAAKARLPRGEQEPIDEFPDGPPHGDAAAMERYLAAFRQWHDTRRPGHPCRVAPGQSRAWAGYLTSGTTKDARPHGVAS